MKSKTIKQRNIPSYPYVFKSVRAKPIYLLVLIIICGSLLLLDSSRLGLIGVLLISIGIFSIIILPDCKIIEYTNDYAIIYNCRDVSECKLIYWEDILSWQYRWHPDKDTLIIELVDYSVEVVETYRRSTVVPFFRVYAANKEKSRGRVKND